MDLAIVGMAPDREIPEDMETWGMLWDPEWLSFDLLFDLHDINYQPKYLDMSRLEEENIITQDNYPLDEIKDLVGDYFQCTLSYMIGLAILQGYDDIYITGVTATEDYSIQRPNIEYLIGFARGRGQNVHVIGESKLLQYEPNVFPNRYGYVH